MPLGWLLGLPSLGFNLGSSNTSNYQSNTPSAWPSLSWAPPYWGLGLAALGPCTVHSTSSSDTQMPRGQPMWSLPRPQLYSSPPGARLQLVTQGVCCPEMWGAGEREREREFLEMSPLGLASLQDLCYVWGCLLPHLLE